MKRNLGKFIRFCFVGGTGLIINLAVTHTFVVVFGFWYFWAFTIGVLCGWTCSFVLNALFTFPDHNKSGYHKKYMLFIASYLVIFALNAALVYMLTTLLGIHYLISISISALTTTLLSFSFNKNVIYRSL
ncbi:MAG: hypothetical protein JWL87_266 [Candidatus Adlerbacteria bacterium]|nr:hypothetical protein [Candidatus Adlerbacteria bacterium]